MIRLINALTCAVDANKEIQMYIHTYIYYKQICNNIKAVEIYNHIYILTDIHCTLFTFYLALYFYPTFIKIYNAIRKARARARATSHVTTVSANLRDEKSVEATIAPLADRFSLLFFFDVYILSRFKV